MFRWQKIDYRRVGLGLMMLAVVLASGQSLSAAYVDLVDGNSFTEITDHNGMTVWKVNGGADNVFISNDYLRIGATGKELALQDLIGNPTITTTGTNSVSLVYANAALRAEVRYTLTGGANGTFDAVINKTTLLTNLGSSSIDMHLFQYSDFDLQFDQKSQLDQIRVLSPSMLLQTRYGTNHALLASVGTTPTHYQVTDNFLDFYFKFFSDQDGPTTLNDTPGVGTLFPDPATDSAFAFQWDRSLGAGQTFAVDSRFQFFSTTVPEPASVALTGLGIAGLLLRTRRRIGGRQDQESHAR